MKILNTDPVSDPAGIIYNRAVVDLANGSVCFEEAACRNMEEVLGGFGRSFQILAKRDIRDAYAPENPLIMNTGLLTGSNIMPGLRTYFSAYSPLKCSSRERLPAAIWSAGSGKFGSKLKWAGIDEVIFENRSSAPVYVVISEGENGPRIELKPAEHLLGLTTHEKIMALYAEYDDAHFAAIGPGGENFRNVLMGAVALSTERELKTGEDKCRFAGRGGMGSVMGSKNLLAIVAQSSDKIPAMTQDVREVNKQIIGGAGAKRYQSVKNGGGGGTWGNYAALQAFYATPENNFRPRKSEGMENLFPENVAEVADIKVEGCFRCGIRCHHNVHRKKSDDGKGEFIARYEYEPLCLFGSNLGILDGIQTAELIQRCDNLGMDAISLATTIGYVLEYNTRHPEAPLLNGAVFGEFDKIYELISETGFGRCSELGHGLKRLSEKLGETDYAMQVKSMELPAYLPETNPGYPWAIAGGHVSMGTALLYMRDGDGSMEYWVTAITQNGVLQIGYDLIGLCKFTGVAGSDALIVEAIHAATGIEISQQELDRSMRRAYFFGLALEKKQGFQAEDYKLPARVFKDPNPSVQLPNFVTDEFFEELTEKVWERFQPEIDKAEQQLMLR